MCVLALHTQLLRREASIAAACCSLLQPVAACCSLCWIASVGVVAAFCFLSRRPPSSGSLLHLQRDTLVLLDA